MARLFRHIAVFPAAALVLALAIILVPRPAAAFGDCNDPDYIASFGPETLPAPPMSTFCVVAFDIAYSSPEGERRIRAIHDLSAGWAIPDPSLRALQDGVRQSIAAFATLGAFAIDDVTILILEDTALPFSDPASADDRMAAGTDSYRLVDGSRTGECLITIFALHPVGLEPDIIRYVIAHELFHCIQGATLTGAQTQTATGDGAWWAEGSAELFVARAIAGIGDLGGRSTAFAEAVDARVPLYDLDYPMAVFFYWFDAEQGISALIPFLHQMASVNSEASQRAAMRAALAPADWLRFAEAYVDRAIRHPQGDGLSYPADEGDEHVFEENRSARLYLDPFVLVRGTARYGCGQWRNEGAPEEDAVAAREAEGRDWGRYPAEVDAREGRPNRYRIAGMNTGDERLQVRIEAERRAGCAPCAGSDRVDACVVGTWVQSGGGAIEWMRSQGMPITSANVSEQIITYADDGSYFTLPFTVELVERLRSRRGVTIAESLGRAEAAGGRWSAEGGRLNTCQESGGVSGSTTVTSPHGTGTMPMAVPGGGILNMDFSCSEGALRTSLSFAGLPPMVTEFARVSPDEPEEEPEEPPPPPGGEASAEASGASGGACPRDDPDPEVEDACDRYRR